MNTVHITIDAGAAATLLIKRPAPEVVRTSDLAGMTMAEVQRLHITNTLQLHGNNRRETAAALEIGLRTLYRYLNEQPSRLNRKAKR